MVFCMVPLPRAVSHPSPRAHLKVRPYDGPPPEAVLAFAPADADVPTVVYALEADALHVTIGLLPRLGQGGAGGHHGQHAASQGHPTDPGSPVWSPPGGGRARGGPPP